MAPDDVSVGQYVTVLGWYDRDTGTWQDEYVANLFGGGRRQRKTDFVGDVLLVEAVCYPFVALRTASGQITTLDLRDAELMRVNESYVAMYVAGSKQPPSPLWELFEAAKRKEQEG